MQACSVATSALCGAVAAAPCRAERWLAVPRLCPQHRQRWSVSFEGCPGGTALDLRRSLSKSMAVPAGKLRLLVGQGPSTAALEPTEPADRATGLYVSLTVLRAAPAAAAAAQLLPRERALALQQELLDGLEALGATASGPAALKEVQRTVLPKYGFSTCLQGLTTMLQAFDEFFGDDEIAKLGEAINSRLGLRPQYYSLER